MKPAPCLILGLVSFVSLYLEATDSTPHRIPRLSSQIKADGVLDEPAWQDAWKTDLPVEVSPGENTPAPVRTEVLVIHDQRHLYVGFRAFDPRPSTIRAHLSDRDDAWNDDWVGVVLDTFNDQRRDYLLVVNPLGVQMDSIEVWPNGGTSWDGIWDSAARITDWGWAAELKIPFSTLRFQRTDGPQVWGFDAIRGYQYEHHRQMGAFPRDRDNNCYLCQSLKIEGFAGISSGKNLEVVPTLTTARTRIDLKAKISHIEDHDGNLLEQESAIMFTVEGPLHSHSYLRPSITRLGYNGQEFDLDELIAHVCLKPNRHSHAWLTLTWGDEVDYTNTRAGRRLRLEPGFWYRFGRHLRVELQHIREEMEVEEGWLYEAGISQLTTSWQFSPRTFVRAIVQDVRYDYHTQLYHDQRDAEQAHLFTQLLFSYKVNPQTVFFVGYSDNAFGNQGFDLTRSDRTFFAKIGYAWLP